MPIVRQGIFPKMFWIPRKGDIGLAGWADKSGGFPGSPTARGAGEKHAGSDYTHEVIAAGKTILSAARTWYSRNRSEKFYSRRRVSRSTVARFSSGVWASLRAASNSRTFAPTRKRYQKHWSV